MASGAIKGITIKLGTDASELTSALYKTESALKSTQGQLRQVNQALKFNPNNVELLQQKFTLLQREIDENEKYVEDLKKALQQMRDAGVDETADEFMTLQRAIIQAESKGEQFKSELQQTKTALDGAEKGTRGLKNALDSVDTTHAKGEISTLQIAMGNLIANGISRLVNAIGNNLGGAIARSDTLANFPKVMEGMGIGAEEAADAVDELAVGLEGLPTTLDDGASAVKRFTAVNGNVDKSTEYFLALNNAILAGGEATEKQQSALEQLSQAYAKGKPEAEEWNALNEAMPAQMQQIAKSMGYASAAVEGDFYNALQSGEISMDDFMQKIVELNQKGGNGFKSFEKQAEGATGGIQTTLTELSTAITRGLQEAIDNIGRENIVAIIDTISSAISWLITMIGNVVGFIAQHSGIFLPLIAALGTFAGIIGVVVSAMRIWAAVQVLLNAALWANPIVLIAAGIVALGVAIYVAYQKSETFRNIVQKIGNFLKGVFFGAINLVKGAIDKASGAVDRIRNAFSSLISKIKSVANSIKGTLKNAFRGLAEIGTNIVHGIWNGISNGLGWIKGKIKGWVGNVKSFLKNLFGIKSPSRWARDIIGYNIVAGMAEGITGNAGLVDAAMGSLMPNITPTMSVNAQAQTLTANDVASGTQAGMSSMIIPMAEAFAVALEGMGIRVDGREFGRVVRGAL